MRNITSDKQRTPCRRQHGFTLPELMVSLVVMAIVMSIAAPSFESLLNRQELSSKASLLSSTLAYARNEAVARVATVALCGSNGANGCSGDSDLTEGWLVFIDANNDGAFVTSDGDELLKQGGDEGKSVSVTLASSATHLSYSEQGESSNAQDIYLCSDGASTEPSKARTLTVSIVGSTRVSTGATCP